MSQKTMELYIHIPFCVKKCQYCDFLSFAADEATQAAYVEALLRADPATRFSVYEKSIQNSIMNPDECRAKEEKNPIPGGLGQRFLATKNLGSLESVLNGGEASG